MVREIRNASLCFLVLWLATPATLQAQTADSSAQTTVAFSDASRPGRLRVDTFIGSIVVRGTNRKDVLVTSREAGPDRQRSRENRTRDGDRTPDDPAAAGLRRLTQPGGFTIEERDNNEIAISSGPMRGVSLEIEVPVRTSLRMSTVSGRVTVESVEGDIEVNATNGAMQLTNVSGSVVALSTNGTITATLSRVTADKAMSFATTNGNVDVTLPASVRANFRLRSDQGDVYTNFDLQIATSSSANSSASRDGGRYRFSVNRTINGSANGGGPEITLRTFNGNVYLRRAQ